MEISNKIPPAYANQAVKPAQAAEKPEKSQGVAPARGDQVTLSERARELHAAQQAVKQMQDIDTEKVARVKAQLEAGTYQIDPKRIADKLLSESLLDQND